MKKLILYCFILFLVFISCSPKQRNKDESPKEPITILDNEQNTSIKSEHHNLTEITEKGAKVFLKGFGDYGSVLVTYNEDDIWVWIYNLLKIEAVVMLQNDNKIIDIDYNHYFNSDTIKVYKECNKESESFFVTKKELEFRKIQGIKDWLYLTSGYPEGENLGFVYVFDISEKSFYGNIEEDKKSGNYYTRLKASEYEIIQRYKNIKRYGPLLAINHNNKTVEFWNSFHTLLEASELNKSYTLLDYYPNYNEILIRTQFYEGSTTNIFNLESGEAVCFVEIPYFNNSRTYMITMFDSGPWGDASLRIYAINNGLYNKLKEFELDWQEFGDIDIKNIVWLNDNNAQINFDNSTSMLVEIGEEVKITGKEVK